MPTLPSLRREEAIQALQFDLLLEIACQLADLNQALHEPQEKIEIPVSKIRAYSESG